MTITFVDDRDEPPLSDHFDAAALQSLASATLTAEGLPADTEVALTLIDVDEMALLNQEHMSKEGPTDVLSFPLETLAPGSPPSSDPAGPPLNVGDVFICPEVVAANAAAACRFLPKRRTPA